MLYLLWSVALALVVLALVVMLTGCSGTPEGGCEQNATNITGSTVNFTSACGGAGDHAAASVVTPAPVVVPPVVITPVITGSESGGGQ